MSQEIIPREIDSILAGESPDFVVKANRKSVLNARNPLWCGLFFMIFPVILFSVVFVKADNLHHVTLHITSEAIFPAILIGIFFLTGLGLTAHSVYSLCSKGAWYIGTAKRLIIYHGQNRMRSIDWEQISGDIETNGTRENGNIILRMRTGIMLPNRRGPDTYVPDLIAIAGIRNNYQIEPMLRKRIKENDPTPSSSSQ